MPNPDDFILETPRLRLRQLNRGDVDALARLYADQDVRRYFPEGTLTYAETQEEVDWIIEKYYGVYGYGLWATIDKQTGAFIGRCGLIPWHLPDRPGMLEVEVAYLLDKAYWRQGLGTEAALAIRDYAFQQLQLPRLICMMYPQNVASHKVAVSMGMTLDREAEDEAGRYWIYSMPRPPAA
jgi:[ribosomal protein S5]-alanine N-acetyltransferase